MKKTTRLWIAIFILIAGLIKSEIKPPAPVNVTTPTYTPQTSATEITENNVLVTRVIDGDTIEVDGGSKVRYIGMNAPESTTRKECFGKEASARNKELVLNRTVRLEKDVSETDKFGRKLRYVWVGDEMINEKLVAEGFANVASYPPDVKYQTRIRQAEKTARENNLGLWGSVCRTQAN